MSSTPKENDFDELIHSFLNMLKKAAMKDSGDNIDEIDEPEEMPEEDQKTLDEFKKDYDLMIRWSGISEKSHLKQEMKDTWSKIHPELPELFMPDGINNDLANVLFLLQVIPLWIEHKKKIKK